MTEIDIYVLTIVILVIFNLFTLKMYNHQKRELKMRESQLGWFKIATKDIYDWYNSQAKKRGLDPVNKYTDGLRMSNYTSDHFNWLSWYGSSRVYTPDGIDHIDWHPQSYEAIQENIIKKDNEKESETPDV